MKTDNSNIKEKIQLRLDCIKKKNISVLDCFSGTGKLWDIVKQKTKTKVTITGIEKERNKNKLSLIGDNIKYLKTIDLSKFDIIDLDAWGYPINQLEILFERKYKGIIIITAIQSMQGGLPRKMLYQLDYTKGMIDKNPTLFYRNGLAKLENYLYLHEVQKIEGYFINNKNYFCFNLN